MFTAVESATSCTAERSLSYADAPLSGVGDVRGHLHDCTADLIRWCASRPLQLNEAKTELAWFGKPSRIASLDSMDRSVTVGSSTINPSSAVRDLGVILDAELTMKPTDRKGDVYLLLPTTQIEACASLSWSSTLSWFMRSSCQDPTTATLSFLLGLPKSTTDPLQRLQNAAARLILGLRARDHVIPALRQLHWLPVHQRIQHKLCTMMHSVHHGMCPAYLADTVSAIADNPTRPGLCSAVSMLYRLPRCTSMGEHAFSFSAPLTWNALPSTLRDIADHTRFRKLLKTHFFNSLP